MKKIIIIINFFLVVFLSSCNTSINSSVYISSIGFEIEDDKLIAYFLSNPLADISRNKDGNDKKPQYVKVEVTNIFEAFDEAERSLLSPLNFRHVKTMILSKEFLESKYLEELLIFLRTTRIISYNFYVFSTTSKIEELYKLSNPEQISYQYSILSSPDLLDYKLFGVEKLHFLDFANDYYNKNRYLHIPTLVVNKDWVDKITVEVDGFICIDNWVGVYPTSIFKGMIFLYNHDAILYDDGENVYSITNYKIKKAYQNDIFTLQIYYDELLYFDGSKKEFEDNLSSDIKKYLDSYIENQNGLYIIKFYNYLNSKKLNVYNYELKFIHNG